MTLLAATSKVQGEVFVRRTEDELAEAGANQEIELRGPVSMVESTWRAKTKQSGKSMKEEEEERGRALRNEGKWQLSSGR